MKKQKKNIPCIIIGWPTISRLAHGETVIFDDVVLMPDDLLFNTANKIQRGEFGSCKCTEPRQVIKCCSCGCVIPPEDVKSH